MSALVLAMLIMAPSLAIFAFLHFMIRVEEDSARDERRTRMHRARTARTLARRQETSRD